MRFDWPAWTDDVSCPWCGNTLLPLGLATPPVGGCPGCHRPVEWQFPDAPTLMVSVGIPALGISALGFSEHSGLPAPAVLSAAAPAADTPVAA